jgi:hypothetical protein
MLGNAARNALGGGRDGPLRLSWHCLLRALQESTP